MFQYHAVIKQLQYPLMCIVHTRKHIYRVNENSLLKHLNATNKNIHIPKHACMHACHVVVHCTHELLRYIEDYYLHVMQNAK